MVLCSAQPAVERDSAYSTTLAVARGKPLAGLREVTELRDGSDQRMSNRCLTGVRGGTRRGVSLGPAHRPAGPATSHRTLVVESDQTVADSVATALRIVGHVVDTASMRAAALALMTRHRYGLVVSSLRMPDLNGPSLYEELARRSFRTLPRLIFITQSPSLARVFHVSYGGGGSGAGQASQPDQTLGERRAPAGQTLGMTVGLSRRPAIPHPGQIEPSKRL